MNSPKPRQDITIVGGGFAGLAAALRLQRSGAKLRLIEKRPFFGGRAYSFREPKSGVTLDNGQHLLMGCYHETFRFLKDLGTFDRLEVQKNLRVAFSEGPRRHHELRCPNWPAPLHLLWGLLRYPGLGWKDKRGMAALLKLSKKVSKNAFDYDEISVMELLRRSGQSETAIQKFWEPFGLATLNEALDLASARLFLEVLRRALLSGKADSSLAIPKVGLSELYANPAETYFREQGIPLHFNSQVLRIERESKTFRLFTHNGESFQSDYLLLAVPPNAAAKILSADKDLSQAVPHLDRFASAPIVSINLWFENFRLPQTMIGLIDSPVHWVFDKGTHLTLVISAAHALAQESKENLIKLAVAELIRFFPELESKKIIHFQVVKEQEATFSSRMSLNRYRPDNKTAVDRLFLAGDWTNTGLPATIESAVASGHRAAELILKENR
ncbi:MAG TPA: hypothetical protein DF383_06350 [Deltaproteobacteria bacterium]|nr:hypothetical protein [Deltaproteobacteria bacterium]